MDRRGFIEGAAVFTATSPQILRKAFQPRVAQARPSLESIRVIGLPGAGSRKTDCFWPGLVRGLKDLTDNGLEVYVHDVFTDYRPSDVPQGADWFPTLQYQVGTLNDYLHANPGKINIMVGHSLGNAVLLEWRNRPESEDIITPEALLVAARGKAGINLIKDNTRDDFSVIPYTYRDYYVPFVDMQTLHDRTPGGFTQLHSIEDGVVPYSFGLSLATNLKTRLCTEKTTPRVETVDTAHHYTSPNDAQTIAKIVRESINRTTNPNVFSRIMMGTFRRYAA